jgi:hypothetical protein
MPWESYPIRSDSDTKERDISALICKGRKIDGRQLAAAACGMAEPGRRLLENPM